jgi:hypothetical protein
MKVKGNTKRAGKIPNFWPIQKEAIPEELKEWVIEQYFSQDSLSVYCDASIKKDNSVIALGCSYVANGTIQVKQQYS